MFVFNSFLKDYKQQIYKHNPFRCPILCVLATSIAFFIIYALYMYYAFLSKTHQMIAIFAILITTIVIAYVVNWFNTGRNIKEKCDNYKNGTISALSNLLDMHDLNDNECIEWLLTYCKDSQNKAARDNPFAPLTQFLLVIVFPLVKIGIDAFLKNADVETFATVYVIIIIFALLLLDIYICFQPFFAYVIQPNKDVISQLKKDLEYYKAVEKRKLNRCKAVSIRLHPYNIAPKNIRYYNLTINKSGRTYRAKRF